MEEKQEQDHTQMDSEEPKMCPPLVQSDRIRELHSFIDKECTAVEKSACQTAAGRALWRHVIKDPVAEILAGEAYLKPLHDKIRLNKSARETPGVMLAIRTLWFDSALESAIGQFQQHSQSQIQVVLLGAGMDVRAYRLPFLSETDIYEVDFPRVINTKSALLEAATAENPDLSFKLHAKTLTRLSADVTSNDWFENLQKSGFSPSQNTVWILEGLLYYLAEAEARAVLKTISSKTSSAGGSAVLLADFMNECSVGGLSAELKSNFQFYSDWPEQLLPSLGYCEDVRVSQIGDSDANFGLVDDDDPLNFFNKMRRLPRYLKSDPDDGMPCRRLYLVRCSVPEPKL